MIMFLKDRIKDVMRVRAKWFGPSELEEFVEKLDEVYEVCVWVSQQQHFVHLWVKSFLSGVD